MDKSSFLIYLDYEEQFNLLTDEQIGQLMRAIIKYEKTREIPQLNGIVKMAFSFIKTQLDRDREKYEARCEKNRENAKKGGRPRKKQKDNLKANGFNENQMDAKKPDDDKEDEEDIDNDLLLKKEKEEKLQQRFIECLNSFNINAISECIKYLDELPFEVIDYVLSKTSGIKCPNWNYANTILQDYVRRKIDSVEKIQAEESGFKNQKQDTSKVVDF